MPFQPRDIDTVFNSYVECALWSSVLNDGAPMDEDYSVEDISPEALHEMRAEVIEAVIEGYAIEGSEKWSDEQFGHDLWLTRNHHGAGFWDRGFGKTGEYLTGIAKNMGSCELHVGDDGKLFI